jgi:Icc-related predicted phosphoesterase
MKIRVMSDLHLEFYENPQQCGIRDDIGCDVVVLAGDTDIGTKGIEWAAETFDEPVIYVMGNHEYYKHDATALLPRARECAAELGVHLLENDEVHINDVRFLGCTLWSGFDSGPFPRSEVMCEADIGLNDFRLIREGGYSLTPSRMIEWYEQSLTWLEQQLTPTDPAVVVTHFAPTLKVVNPRFGMGDMLTPYFHSDLEHLMGAAVPVWLYGHNHYSATEVVEGSNGSTLVASNQLGYPGENVEFQRDYVITV